MYLALVTCLAAHVHFRLRKSTIHPHLHGCYLASGLFSLAPPSTNRCPTFFTSTPLPLYVTSGKAWSSSGRTQSHHQKFFFFFPASCLFSTILLFFFRRQSLHPGGFKGWVIPPISVASIIFFLVWPLFPLLTIPC